MGYEYEEIKESQEVFYYLLENHELSEASDARLYESYVQNESVQNLVKSQGNVAMSTVERYGNVIYLIPQEENNFLGYSRTLLKQELCKSTGTMKDYYLSQFVILVLLVEFYDGQGSSSKTRDYMRVGELQNSVSKRLRDGAEVFEEEEMQENAGIAYSDMLEAYEALRSDEKKSRAKTTKEGFMYSVLRFLQNQGLIEYIEEDEMIKTTKKLDNFMDWNLLNQNNYRRVLKVLEEVDE